MDALLERTREALIKNRMNCIVVKTKEEAKEKVLSIIEKGATVACGGSVTLNECGVIDALRSGEYKFLDRFKEGLSGEELTKIYREAFFADYFLSSSNAITEKGELYNVDGRGNRVAAMIYGPDKVIVVAGKNKIVPDLRAADIRVKAHAAPKNTQRLGCETYCNKKGACVALGKGGIGAGCDSDGRICCDYVVMAHQREKGRITVILVDEALGY